MKPSEQKATITITEAEEGFMNIKLDFDPPINANDEMNSVVACAMRTIELLKGESDED